MKKYTTLLALVLSLSAISPLFAQHGRFGRGYYAPYAYGYRPYGYAPFRTSVSVMARLPFGAVALHFGGRPYHYYDGLYYSPWYGGYRTVPPPIGLVVPVLPTGGVSVIIGGRSYYRYQSVFYLPLGNSYQVVQAPREEGTEPTTQNKAGNNDGFEKFVLEGKTYYKKGNKYYKARVADNGEVIYEEAGATSK